MSKSDVRREQDVLRELVREAHAATKDLRKTLREAGEERERVKAAVKEMVAEEIGGHLDEQLKILGEEVQESVRRGRATVIEEFEKLATVVLHGNEQGRGPTVFEKVDALRKEVEKALAHNKIKLIQEDEDGEEMTLPSLPELGLNREGRRRLLRKLQAKPGWEETVQGMTQAELDRFTEKAIRDHIARGGKTS